MLSTSINSKGESKGFDTFFDLATVSIIITDNSGKIIAINPFALTEFGYFKNELIGKKIELLIPARFHEKHFHYYNEYIANPRPWPMGKGKEVVALKKNGNEFPVEISLSNYNEQGINYSMAFLINISDRKKNEAEIKKLHTELELTVEQRTADLKNTLQKLKKSTIKLEEATSFQKALLDNAGAMIIATNKEGIITLFNPEASRNTGYLETELINKHTPLLFHDKTEIARKRIALFNEFGIHVKDDFAVVLEGCKRNISSEEEYTHIRKDGTTFPVSLTVTTLFNKEGECTGYMGIVFDISKRKKMEEELRKSLDMEKEHSVIKSRFVTMASHEFRTPLSTVLSSAFLIEKYTTADDQPKREKHLQRIISSVTMLTDILNDFLSVGKIEEGKIQVRLTQFKIPEFIKSIISELKNSLKKKQKIIYHHVGNSIVFLDSSLLKHIVMNLISNASKFSSEGSRIEIYTNYSDNNIILSVKDQGIGISKDDQKHLMERFFRGINSLNIQGTGLGLHIVSKYAELMNGKVECISELEKGTEFIISFYSKID